MEAKSRCSREKTHGPLRVDKLLTAMRTLATFWRRIQGICVWFNGINPGTLIVSDSYYGQKSCIHQCN